MNSKLRADYILDMKRVKELEAQNKTQLAQLQPVFERNRANEMVTRNTINYNLAMNKLNSSYKNICNEWRRKQMVTYLTDVVERTKLFNEDLSRVEEEHETLLEQSCLKTDQDCSECESLLDKISEQKIKQEQKAIICSACLVPRIEYLQNKERRGQDVLKMIELGKQSRSVRTKKDRAKEDIMLRFVSPQQYRA
ncbi:17526_t:CDS:2 [Funneliformis geosporum]|nr:17526_t:CDS:2 [Funneliformis geosporum]